MYRGGASIIDIRGQNYMRGNFEHLGRGQIQGNSNIFIKLDNKLVHANIFEQVHLPHIIIR